MIKLASILCLLICQSSYAHWQDPNGQDFSWQDPLHIGEQAGLSTNKQCSDTPSGALSLHDIVDIALCNHPTSQRAWADVKQQLAQQGVAQAARLPSINFNSNLNTSRSSTSNTTLSRSYSLNLSWLLFDFGLNRANLSMAQYQLSAAQALQQNTLQTITLNVALAYYDVVSAQATHQASLSAEQAAREGWLAATAKHEAGAGSLADKLQAQTHYAQTSIARTRAHAALQHAHGQLAVMMGQRADHPVLLQEQALPQPDEAFNHSVKSLLDEIVYTHPKLQAVRAQIQAAQADIDAIQAAGKAQLSLNAGYGYTRQGYNAGEDYRQKQRNIGVELRIPLFEGYGRSYKIQSAQAALSSRQTELLDSEQQISLDIWRNYYTLQAESGNLKLAQESQESAERSYEITQGRYKAGIGNMLELLNAQSSLVEARLQRIRATLEWNSARLRLAAGLGRIGGREI